MKQPEDKAWDCLVHTLELEAAAVDLPQVEAEVRTADPDHVSLEWIEALVQRTVAVPPQPMPRSRLRRLLTAAAVLLLLLLTAGVTARLLIWPQQRDSRTTLPYFEAIALVLAPEQREFSRITALSRLGERIDAGIQTLQQVEHMVGCPPPITALAHRQSAAIERVLLGAPASSGLPAIEDQLALMTRALDPTADESTRLGAVQALGDTTLQNLAVVMQAPQLTPRLAKFRADALASLRRRFR